MDMNFFNKKALVAFALLSFSGSAFGYRWSFTNVTSKPLLVEVTLAGWSAVYYHKVLPGRNADFSWPFGNPRAFHCISTIRVAKLSRAILGKVNYEKCINWPFEGVPNDIPLQLFIDHPLREVPIQWLSDRGWGMFDAKAQRAAGLLAKSVGNALSKTVKIVMQAAAATAVTAGTGGAGAPVAPVAAKAVGSVLDFGPIFTALGETISPIVGFLNKSKCVSRNFDIVEIRKRGIILATHE